MTANTYRFSLAKDLKEWIDISKKEPWGSLSSSDEKTWSYDYLGQEEFLPFMNIYTSEIEKFSKYFPDMDIWLKNIYWKEVFANSQSILEQILSKKYKEATFSVIHLFPLEMVIVGEVLKSLGGTNTVYNFNRMPVVNSISKTLEAGLFLVSWKQIEWLSTPMNTLIGNIAKKFNNPSLSSHFFLFDENDTVPNWNITRIDSYVKGAIGFKESVVTYHTEEFPSKEFLVKHGFKNIIFSDTDMSNAIDTYYKGNLGKVFATESVTLSMMPVSSIGYYEDYVTVKNTEYLKYRKDIMKNTQEGKIRIGNSGGTEKWNKVSAINKGYSGTTSPITLKEGIAYLGGLAILLPIFLMLESSKGTMTFKSNIGTGSTVGGTSGVRSSGGWGGSFTKSSSSSSASSVSSFGGGGFSKGGG